MVTETFYALRDIKTGKMLYLEKESNGNAGCCGDYTYRIVRYETACGYFQLKSKLDMWFALYNPEYWYNSSEENPVHSLDVEQIEIVERKITIEENEIYPEPNAYYEMVGRFIRHEYSQDKYHYNSDDVEDMVKSFACIEPENTLSIDMWSKFLTWMQENNEHLPQTNWSEEK